MNVPDSPQSANEVVLQSNTPERRKPLMDVPIFLHYWRVIQRFKLLIAGVIFAFLILGLLVTLLMTPKFTASSRVEISRAQDNVTNVEGVQQEEVGQSLEFYQTQYSLLEARTLAGRVVRSLNLARDDSFFATFDVDPDASGMFDFSENANLTQAQRNERERIAIEILKENISISPIRGSSLVDVGFTSPDAKLSAKVANSWIAQYIESNLDRRFASTSDARKFLEQRLAQLRGRLEQSERDLVGYASRKRIITLSGSETLRWPDEKRTNSGR